MRVETPVIIDAVRSPMGSHRPGGALSSVSAVELLAQVLSGLMDRNDLDSGLVDDVLICCANQTVDQSGTPWRWASLAAGVSRDIPAASTDRRFDSSQRALHTAAHGVMAGEYDVVVVSGIESTRRVPMGSAHLGDGSVGAADARCAPALAPQGISAELVATKWNLTRDQLDEYAIRSQQRAAEVAAAGEFDTEIIPISSWTEETTSVVRADETIRPDTTAEKLAGLKPWFDSPEMRRRFPEIPWRITAGNSSQPAHGASAVLITSERRAVELSLEPRARLHAFAVACADPIAMLTGPITATREALTRGGLRASEIDHFEVDEAFASVPLAWQAEMGVSPDVFNPRGGSIALGHPLGASGTRLMTTMLNALEATGGRYGLQTTCEADGMASATIIARR